MFTYVVQWLLLGVGVVFALGSLLALSRHPHWFIRGWDFPRVQIAVIIAVCGAGYALLEREWGWYDAAVLGVFAASLLWHLATIIRYTRLWPAEVKAYAHPTSDRSLRMVMTNVKMQNRDYERWRQVVLREYPDLILAVETDQAWCDQLQALSEYPHRVLQPQDNMYGMAMVSKLELVDPRVEFLRSDDYPSIHTQVRLRTGELIRLHGLHPPPPEPIRNTSSSVRDAELVVMGRDRLSPDEAVVVAGDLNDVAWSHTTRLFQRLSGLLDPRIGRGFYNTWNANSRWFRFPLDHVFHSDDFRLIELRRLEHVGSDHFPVLADLSYEPELERQQPRPQEKAGDREEAEEKIEQQQEEEQQEGDRGR